jgi:hypothetical protein
MSRCRLDGPEGGDDSVVRYVPLAELDLWRHLMETRHGRRVCIEEVSVWIPDHSTARLPELAAEDLEPVLRVRLELPGPHDVPLAVERFFPAATSTQAREAWLSHFDRRRVRRIVTVAGYFVRGGRLLGAPAA